MTKRQRLLTTTVTVTVTRDAPNVHPTKKFCRIAKNSPIFPLSPFVCSFPTREPAHTFPTHEPGLTRRRVHASLKTLSAPITGLHAPCPEPKSLSGANSRVVTCILCLKLSHSHSVVSTQVHPQHTVGDICPSYPQLSTQ